MGTETRDLRLFDGHSRYGLLVGLVKSSEMSHIHSIAHTVDWSASIIASIGAIVLTDIPRDLLASSRYEDIFASTIVS